jgi:hypothetical protein
MQYTYFCVISFAEVTFHLPGILNLYHCRIWASGSRNECIEYKSYTFLFEPCGVHIQKHTNDSHDCIPGKIISHDMFENSRELSIARYQGRAEIIFQQKPLLYFQECRLLGCGAV